MWYGCVSIHTTCGMNAHLYHIVGLSMLDSEDHNTCMSVTVRMLEPHATLI